MAYDDNEHFRREQPTSYDEEEKQSAKEEWELLIDTFRRNGFDLVAQGVWVKWFYNSARWIEATYDNDWIQFNFNDEDKVYVTPNFVIDFFLNKRSIMP